MARSTVLMVEGKDDKHVVQHICGAHQLGKIDKIIDYGGIDPLIQGIAVRVKESDISAVGIIVDADSDLASRWQSVVDRLRGAGYEKIPRMPPSSGLVLEPISSKLLPRLGVWVMPNNQVPGLIEDFLGFLVPEGDQLFQRITKFLNELPQDLRRFPEMRRSKALVHSWLAYQEEPGRPLGQAVSARYFDPRLPTVEVFVTWLRRVFFEVEPGAEAMPSYPDGIK